MEKIEEEFIELECSPENAVVLCNCMNEVCHGFALNNFEKVIGTSKENAKEILYLIANVYEDKKEILLKLDKRYLAIICNSMAQCLIEFNYVDEFHTRIGANREEAEELIEQLKSMI
jgi:hypothetical protein